MLHLLCVVLMVHFCFAQVGVSEELASCLQESEMRRPQEPQRPLMLGRL